MTKNELAISFVNTIAKEAILLFGCDNLLQAKQNLDIFNEIKELDKALIQNISNSFRNIDESIYNPSKW